MIKDFIDTYYDENAVEYLIKLEKKLDQKLKIRFFPQSKIKKREITIKQNLLDNFSPSMIFSNISQPFKDRLIKKFFPYPENIPCFYDDVIQLDNNWTGDIYS